MATSDIAELKARFDLSAVIGRDVQLKRSSRELVGLCPFHDEKTPSFRVNDAKGVFHCFGCGAGGDVIDYVRWRHRLDFIEAVRWLEDGVAATSELPKREVLRQDEEHGRAEAIAAAQAQWLAAGSVKGTPAELYLRLRGIVEEPPPTIRFGRVQLWRNATSAKAPRLPALIAACEDVGGTIVGVQRVFLTKDGSKAAMKNPKLSLGQIRGGALRLGPIAAEVILCEGPEDGLTLRQRLPGASIWVTLGTGNLPFVELPASVRSVVIAGDNNPAGRRAAEVAAQAFAEQGRGVRVMFPDPAYTDWNDELLGRRARTG